MTFDNLTVGELIEILQTFDAKKKLLIEWSEIFEIDDNDDNVNIIP